MVKRYFYLFLLSLICLPSFSIDSPKTVAKKNKAVAARSNSFIELVKTSGRSYILHSNKPTRNISFMITDSRGVVVMMGDSYPSGSVLDLNHFKSGNYTMYFDKDTNAEAAYFTVSK